MISVSVRKTEQKLLTWRLWEQSGLEPGVREAEHFTYLTFTECSVWARPVPGADMAHLSNQAAGCQQQPQETNVIPKQIYEGES